MPGKRGEVAVIAARAAARSVAFKQIELSAQASEFLRGIALVAIVGVRVLAAKRAESPLTSAERFLANDAMTIGFHTKIIIQTPAGVLRERPPCYDNGTGL